jgi:enolase-phosphatase E1
VTFRLAEHGVAAVLLDVEGTMTPIAFVTEVLFPYARTHVDAYVRDHASDPAVRPVLEALRAEQAHGAPSSGAPSGPGNGSVAAYARLLMDRDSKSSALKTLQGLIWKVGFDSGALHGEVFDDVPAALRRWRATGIRTAIYSSGSVLAQKLLFGSTTHGDLTPDLDAHFDTAVGPKRDPRSYARIADALGTDPASILFLSDTSAELDAARTAGCQVALTVRPGNSPQPASEGLTVVKSFDEVVADVVVGRRP